MVHCRSQSRVNKVALELRLPLQVHPCAFFHTRSVRACHAEPGLLRSCTSATQHACSSPETSDASPILIGSASLLYALDKVLMYESGYMKTVMVLECLCRSLLPVAQTASSAIHVLLFATYMLSSCGRASAYLLAACTSVQVVTLNGGVCFIKKALVSKFSACVAANLIKNNSGAEHRLVYETSETIFSVQQQERQDQTAQEPAPAPDGLPGAPGLHAVAQEAAEAAALVSASLQRLQVRLRARLSHVYCGARPQFVLPPPRSPTAPTLASAWAGGHPGWQASQVHRLVATRDPRVGHALPPTYSHWPNVCCSSMRECTSACPAPSHACHVLLLF